METKKDQPNTSNSLAIHGSLMTRAWAKRVEEAMTNLVAEIHTNLVLERNGAG